MIKSNHIISDIKYEGELPNIEKLLDEAISKVNELNVVNKFVHNFQPNGISLVYVLAESHISIHTWEEYNYLSIDFYTCGDTTPTKTLDTFLNNFKIIEENRQTIQRGIK